MNTTPEEGIGGVFLRISARPSIHNHLNCIFARGEIMTRYGIRSNSTTGNSNENRVSSEEQGADEVDNMLSKPVHPIRPPSRQKNGHRRNSLEMHTSTDYDDNNVLSKSVPATLPSQLHYSVSDDDDLETSVENHFSNVSCNSFSTPNKSNTSRNTSFSSQRQESVQFAEQTQLERDRQCSPKATVYLICIVVCLCAVVFSSGLNVGQMSGVNLSTYDKSRFYTDVSSLGEKYNVGENSILQVQTGISTIFEKQDTGSFMFVYNSYAQSFNPSEFNEFINDVSLAAAKYLRNDSTPRHYTTVDGSKLDMKEHAELICRYRAELAGTGVMVVRHLEAVPADLAMAFHYYCDEYNPLVKKTAIFFTLNIAECSKGPDKKATHAVIEKCLTEKWRDVPLDSIGPLLTRVVSVVIDVTSVF